MDPREKFYKVKYIKRKNKKRKIIMYSTNGAEMRKYHEKICAFLNENTNNSIFAKAYAPHSSIFANAEAHLYNDIFIKMDIHDFFPSINHKYLAETLFHEISMRTEISRVECYDIVKKCSVGNKGLPLGLVSSPSLANLYLKEFDGLFYGAIKKMNLTNPIFTRYADDLVVSFKYVGDYYIKAEKIINLAKSLLRRFYLELNDKKTSIYNLNKTNHVRITGVSITANSDGYRHISVGRSKKEKLFWDVVNMYESENKDYYAILKLKGLYSFVLSVEKKGIEDILSEKMKGIIIKKGFNSFTEMVKALN